ncbi:hypothetical protein [Myxosarcina sp. GI1(2024)]
MQTAISLKYALLPITAQGASYSDYLDLGLVCPHCHHPVYLVKSRNVENKFPRKTRSGELKKFRSYRTDPYFAHFKVADEKFCQFRQKTIPLTSDERSIVNSTRNQRFKLFEAKIKSIK